MDALGRITEGVFEKSGFMDSPLMKDMNAGMTQAQAMGLSREDLDVIYAVAFSKLNAGDAQAAWDGFTYLVMIDPIHAPNYYCLGIACMQLGDWDGAENIMLSFLALDATNPVGYLRLGEIFNKRGDRKRALEAIKLAEAECLAGNGDAVTLAEARSTLALMQMEK